MIDSGDGSVAGLRRSRKRWSVRQKCEIVEETFVSGVSVSVVARRHQVNANQVFAWRQRYRQGTLVGRHSASVSALSSAAPDLLRMGVVAEDGEFHAVGASKASVPAKDDPLPVMASPMVRPCGMVEIELNNGIKLRMDAGIDKAALRQVLLVTGEVA